MTQLTPQEIEKMPYVDFISLLDETNRCPGGKQTIRKIVTHSKITSASKVLEIGSNTGFSSLEVARVVKCSVVGIEPVISAVECARETLAKDTSEIKELVRFEQGSAYDLQFKDNQFDLIIAGGSTSFMDRKNKAIEEFERVLKPWGFLSVTNLFYRECPPQEVLKAVSDIIGVEIKPWTARDWINIYKNSGNFELYYLEENDLESRSQEDLNQYVDYFMAKPHIAVLPDNVKNAIRARWLKTLTVFNENHKYLGFIIALLRKRLPGLHEEPEFFYRKMS